MAKKLKSAKPIEKVKKVKKIKPVKAKKVRKKRKAKDVGTSKIEGEFKLFLIGLNVKVSEQFEINQKFFDFIIDGTKILIEFHGSYWHCDPKLYPNGPINKVQRKNIDNDRYKKALASYNGYKLIEIWENDYRSDSDKVKEYLIEKIKEYK